MAWHTSPGQRVSHHLSHQPLLPLLLRAPRETPLVQGAPLCLSAGTVGAKGPSKRPASCFPSATAIMQG